MTTRVTIFFEVDMAHSLEEHELAELAERLAYGVEATCRAYSAVKISGGTKFEEVESEKVG